MMPLTVTGASITTCLLFSWFIIVLLSVADANEQVEKAIQILREKLNETNQATTTNRQSPQLQHTLAQLLESTDDGDLNEIAALYQEAGSNDDGNSSRTSSLPINTRIECLVRAAQLYQSLGDRITSADCYYDSLVLVEDPDVVAQILKLATPILILHLESSNEAIRRIQKLGINLCTNRFPTGIPEVHQFCGAVLRKLGHKMEAHRAYHMATVQPHGDDSTLAQSLILASSAAREAGMDIATQLEYLIHAMSLRDLFDDILADLYNNMGIVYKNDGQRNEAIQYFRLALQVNHNDGHAQVQLASLNDDVSSVRKLDAEYVSGLFDGYSARFERELVDTLQYKGHIMVAESLKQVWKRECSSSSSTTTTSEKDHRDVFVVDLGCGTGLLGEELYTQEILSHDNNNNVHLVGVDLSPRMIDLARSKQMRRTDDGTSFVNVYNEVHEKDAVELLSELDAKSVDAVVAADVFIYIGDLQATFQELHRCLVDGGFVGFTIELLTNNDETWSSPSTDNDSNGGMRLLPSGRFGHSESYIRGIADRFGFSVVKWEMESKLRLQGGRPVPGAAVILRKEGIEP